MSTLTTNHPASVMGRSSSPAGSWLEQQARFAGANKLLKGSMATHEVNKTHEEHQPLQPQQSQVLPIGQIGQLVSKMPYRRLIAAVDCTVLPNGGWQIPDGSVIPAYTQIPPLSVIGKDCVFGHHCAVLDCCTVGSDCVFGEACSFIGLPVFGDRCVFAGQCEFSAGARFGAACVFGPVPRFNFQTSFGPYCVFADGTDFDEFGLEFGHGCVGAPSSQAEGAQHVH